jgi:hypothetical protein
MTNEPELNSLLSQALEKAKKEGYLQGWRDALATVSKAVGEAGEPEVIPDINSLENVSSTTHATAGGPTVGSTPWYVLQTVKKRPGMTGSEVVAVVKEGGHKVSEGSIRTSLVRLKNRKLIVSRHGKWFSA